MSKAVVRGGVQRRLYLSDSGSVRPVRPRRRRDSFDLRGGNGIDDGRTLVIVAEQTSTRTRMRFVVPHKFNDCLGARAARLRDEARQPRVRDSPAEWVGFAGSFPRQARGRVAEPSGWVRETEFPNPSS